MAKKKSNTILLYIVLAIVVAGAVLFLRKKTMELFQDAPADTYQLVGIRIVGSEAAMKRGFNSNTLKNFVLKDANTGAVVLDSNVNTFSDSLEPRLLDAFFPNIDALNNSESLPLEKAIAKFKGGIDKPFGPGQETTAKNMIFKKTGTKELVYEPPLTKSDASPVLQQLAQPQPQPQPQPQSQPQAERSPADTLSKDEVNSLRELIKRLAPPKSAAKPTAAPAKPVGTTATPVPALPGR